MRYILFNKPYDVLSTFTDEEGRNTLKHYIDVPEVYSAGRLDRDSEGLLILTDDGTLIHRLTDPNQHLPKTYLVMLEGTLTSAALARLEQGIEIQGYKTRRCQVLPISDPQLPERSKPVTPHGPTFWVRMVLHEGKKRQIRHMTAAVGLPTLRLVRIAIGSIGIGTLKPGEWRDLTPAEVQGLTQLIGKGQRRKKVN
jgi:23S rRNA pseudouridine2457 synthase